MNNPQPTGTTSRRRATTKLSPLSYERIAILTAVAAGPISKARIADAVLADSVAAIVIKLSTTYFPISELTKAGYLQINGSYTLTDKGWRTLQNELKRIEQQRLILKTRLHA